MNPDMQGYVVRVSNFVTHLGAAILIAYLASSHLSDATSSTLAMHNLRSSSRTLPPAPRDSVVNNTFNWKRRVRGFFVTWYIAVKLHPWIPFFYAVVMFEHWARKLSIWTVESDFEFSFGQFLALGPSVPVAWECLALAVHRRSEIASIPKSFFKDVVWIIKGTGQPWGGDDPDLRDVWNVFPADELPPEPELPFATSNPEPSFSEPDPSGVRGSFTEFIVPLPNPLFGYASDEWRLGGGIPNSQMDSPMLRLPASDSGCSDSSASSSSTFISSGYSELQHESRACRVARRPRDALGRSPPARHRASPPPSPTRWGAGAPPPPPNAPSPPLCTPSSPVPKSPSPPSSPRSSTSPPALPLSQSLYSPERVWLGALIAASKYTQDSTLKNVHWALCTGVFGVGDVGRIEREFWGVLDWELGEREMDLLVPLQHRSPRLRCRAEGRASRARLSPRLSRPPRAPRAAAPARPRPPRWHHRVRVLLSIPRPRRTVQSPLFHPPPRFAPPSLPGTKREGARHAKREAATERIEAACVPARGRVDEYAPAASSCGALAAPYSGFSCNFKPGATPPLAFTTSAACATSARCALPLRKTAPLHRPQPSCSFRSREFGSPYSVRTCLALLAFTIPSSSYLISSRLRASASPYPRL
ncbi:hypothetical protein FB451DRAFT_1494448 [Mycena latifolia]|nr:hypothetical protein FB451DRAFT_1494448 [Mycena latifolia]